MRERAGIEDDAEEALRPSALQPVHELSLVIRLPALHPHAAFAAVLSDQSIDGGERDATIDRRLAYTEQIEVHPVENERGGHA